MKDLTNRAARFRCVIALILDGTPRFFEGSVEGSILRTPKGRGGFGYDPVFLPDGFVKTFAEMTEEEKNTISHRKRALEKMALLFA